MARHYRKFAFVQYFGSLPESAIEISERDMLESIQTMVSSKLDRIAPGHSDPMDTISCGDIRRKTDKIQELLSLYASMVEDLIGEEE